VLTARDDCLLSQAGVAGDATVATAEKGRLMFDRATESFVQFVREFRARRDVIPEDMH